MEDTYETNLPAEENGKLEETKVPAAEPENTTEEVQSEGSIVIENIAEEPEPENTTEEVQPEGSSVTENIAGEPEPDDPPGEVIPVTNSKLTKEEILAKLTGLANAPAAAVRNEVEALKQAFYKIHKLEAEELKKTFLEAGGAEEDFRAPEDGIEVKIRELLNVCKEKRATAHAEEEQRKAANYALKLQLISRMKELTESQDDFNKLYNEFKEIQRRWKEAKPVPQERANELWKNYQTYSERFYDLIKINNQFRDYDFKKNLELKTALCETVEKLANERDVVSAFHQLQKLHQQWRETGPVAKDLREELWGRFKIMSAIINKRHQDHFEGLKSKEQENLEAKTSICEQIENIDYSLLKTFKDWEDKNKEIVDLQKKWKQIGFAPKKHNVKIFERFRAACDIYFQQKGAFYRTIKEEMERNLEMKKSLCEQADALKNSTEWKETTEKMIDLQKEWKAIGSVPRRHSDAVWKRFIASCDYFFEQKNKVVSSQKNTEQANLAAKKELIRKIKAIGESLGHAEALGLIKNYMAEWNATGFVPFREKDKLYKEYHEAIDKHFDRLGIDQSDRKMQAYRSNLSDIVSADKGKGKLYGERDKLMRAYERMKSDLQTYENNIGFLSISSKGGGGLLKELERKIEKIKEEMALIIKKIEAIDENLE